MSGDDRKDIVITGTPGVGMSRSITYGLKRLLEAGRRVVLDLRREGRVFAFEPKRDRSGKVYDCRAWVCRHNDLETCAALRDRNVCFIVNSGSYDYDSIPLVAAQRVLVGPLDSCINDTLFAEGAEFRVVPPCSREELIAIQSVWHLTPGQVCAKFSAVGGVTRRIFSHGKEYFEDAMTTLQSGATAGKLSDLKRLFFGQVWLSELERA
jgi:hypothetical protein